MGDDPHFRRTARQAFEWRIRYRRDAEGAPLEQDGRLVDLGLGGARVRADRPPPRGTRLRLRLDSPSAWDPLEIVAEVRWVDEDAGLFGLAFAPLRRAEATALHALLSAGRFGSTEGGA